MTINIYRSVVKINIILQILDIIQIYNISMKPLLNKCDRIISQS